MSRPIQPPTMYTKLVAASVADMVQEWYAGKCEVPHMQANTFEQRISRFQSDLSQASVAAALEAAANAAWLAGPSQDLAQEELSDIGKERRDMAMRCEKAIRALITPDQHDALAAHVAAEMAKARAEDAAKIAALVDTVKRLNAACDAMWNDHERLEKNAGYFAGQQPWQLKDAHMRAISEAQQAALNTLNQIGAKP